MWKLVKIVSARGWLWRKLLLLACVTGVGVAAFCWGRSEALPQSATAPPAAADVAPVLPGNGSDYSRRVVAYIHKNKPITREDLGEYLIARFGPERVEFLVNRFIIEHACQAHGIQVSEAEIATQLHEDLRGFGNITLDQFVNQILKRYNKSLYEWKEDVIRPKLALSKFCRHKVTVTQEDLHKTFEAKYGPKVECRMIVFPKEMPDHLKNETYTRIREDNAEFDRVAKSSHIPALAASGGTIPPIHRHFGDKRVETEAFNLKPSEVTAKIAMPDGTDIVLKCVKHIPADASKKLEDERLALHKEIFEMKLAQEIPKVFQELRTQAVPQVFLKKDTTMEELARLLPRQAPSPAVGSPLPAPAVGAPPATQPRGN